MKYSFTDILNWLALFTGCLAVSSACLAMFLGLYADTMGANDASSIFFFYALFGWFAPFGVAITFQVWADKRENDAYYASR